jgi:hypothetical protein
MPWAIDRHQFVFGALGVGSRLRDQVLIGLPLNRPVDQQLGRARDSLARALHLCLELANFRALISARHLLESSPDSFSLHVGGSTWRARPGIWSKSAVGNG